MPVTAAATRANLADTALSNRANVVGGQLVQVNLFLDGVQAKPEDIFDGLGSVYGAAATLTTALAGANNDLTYTARQKGNNANSITIAYVVAGLTTPLTVGVVGNAITVNVATDGAGAATSTAAAVRDLVNKDVNASALVFAANAAANDGTGVVTALAATPLAGGDSKVTAEGDVAARNVYRWRVRP